MPGALPGVHPLHPIAALATHPRAFLTASPASWRYAILILSTTMYVLLLFMHICPLC